MWVQKKKTYSRRRISPEGFNMMCIYINIIPTHIIIYRKGLVRIQYIIS